MLKDNKNDNLYENPQTSNITNIEYEDEFDQEFEEDIKLEIIKNMIRNNRPIKHIIEDTGCTEDEIIKLKEIIELVKKCCDRLKI